MELMEAIDLGAVHPFRHIGGLRALDPLFVTLHYLGHPFVLLGLLAVSVGFLLSQGTQRAALALTLATVLAVVINIALKFTVAREWPNASWTPPSLPREERSFPSAHSLVGTAFFVTLGLIAARRKSRAWPMLLGIGLAFLVGVNQLLTGRNFISDVVAGWACGAVLVLFAAALLPAKATTV